MAEEFSVDQAKAVIDGGLDEAKALIDDPEKMSAFIGDLEGKVKELPSTVVDSLKRLPTMISLVKSYITKEYPEVSPKVIASVVSALLYLVSKKDLIRDDIPIIGLADDVAVIALALKLNESELDAFETWQKTQVQEA